MARTSSQKRQSKTKGAASATQHQTASDAETDAIEMLKADHRKVEGLFSQFENASDSSRKEELAEQICDELIIHSKIEEQIFYPACRRAIDDQKIMNEAEVEHDSAKVLIADIMESSPDDAFFDAKVKVLSEQIKHHVQEEEKKSQNMFAQAKKAGIDTKALGEQMNELKQQLKTQAEGRGLAPPQPRTFDRQKAQNGYREMDMPRGQERDRDEFGRFVSDDDDYRRGGYRSRSRFDDDDDYRRSQSFSSRGRRYEEDDDDRRFSRDRSQGGWFGDSEGHSEAARRGWEDRGGFSRSSSRGGRYDDDNGYSSRGRSGGGRDHGQGGWFGDPEGHSEASRRGWENRDDDRGSSRSSSRGGYGSRSRYEDDDDYRSSSRSRGRDQGQGGWFGDPEGHSQASRRGWEHRR